MLVKDVNTDLNNQFGYENGLKTFSQPQVKFIPHKLKIFL